MPKPRILDVPTLIERFGTEDKCHEYLEGLRWPDGICCPRCGSDKISRIKARRQFDCGQCRYQFSVRVGTILHDSHLPLWKWFFATYMITHAKKGVAALHLQKLLGVSYKTAWYLSHRIRAAMKQDNCEKLDGVVEIDETWIGGKERGWQWKKSGRKTIVAGAVERGGDVRFQIVKDVKSATLRQFIDNYVDDDATDLMTDTGPAYRKSLSDHNTRHHTVNHAKKEWVRGNVHTNTIEGLFGLLKRAVNGTYHHLSKKHLPAYLDERAFVHNNRDNPHIFRDTILGLITNDNLTFQELVG